MKGKPVELNEKQLEDYAAIAYAASMMVAEPGAFTQNGMSFDKKNECADIWSRQVCCCDAIGWLLRAAAKQLDDSTAHREPCYLAVDHINERVLRRTGMTLAALNDESEGPEAVAAALMSARKSFLYELEERKAPPAPVHRTYYGFSRAQAG